ncbi:MAG: 50S ribosomal protein L1 [Alphaproteobacteria bacterium]|nr:MAG: 50S ribosomal protein L1 [Alphaproteobacteria bacterium]TAF14372.1 MAG: 50S ribosomal protein L1 [Alphaproteobacteria bacterium]TAF41463.1 MAG: 50S ribosomal protein L1 [Alphaproteobacteria bacterium]TAF75712.1 MAG: 50S ribosomal protein L1 [Alphaproteobacteria bacterium]
MAKIGKRIKQARSQVNADKLYAIADALEALKAGANAKFDETIEVAVALGVDARKSDQMVRGTAALPHGTGKTVRVAVFARDAKAAEAQAAGADIVGAEELVDKILQGEILFDRCIATPDMMGLVGRVAKTLGPKGLMPNPKLGTVTPNVADAVKAAKSGEIQFRMEKAGIVHAGIGKASFPADALKENLRAFMSALERSKPATSKGVFIKRVSVSSTMGVGMKVEINTIAA